MGVTSSVPFVIIKQITEVLSNPLDAFIKVMFGCRYWSPDIGIGIRFPQYCCLDAHGIEIWH